MKIGRQLGLPEYMQWEWQTIGDKRQLEIISNWE